MSGSLTITSLVDAITTVYLRGSDKWLAWIPMPDILPNNEPLTEPETEI
jgi:hypothetical protein